MSLRFESLESAVRISQGHLEDVPDDPNPAAVYIVRGQLHDQLARLSGNYVYNHREQCENRVKRGLARLIIYYCVDNYAALERARVPHTRQHIRKCIKPSLVRGASSAFVFFIYTRIVGSKVAFSGRY